MGNPHQDDIKIQFVCPSFIRRKQKAKNKAIGDLTTDDVRLVVNFSPLNEYLKNIPTVKTNQNDILVTLGKWKHLIVFDLYQEFFQNHVHPGDFKWLGVATPFGGIKYMKRSGQGLLGQSEELSELLSIILKEEIQSGTCCKLADDIYIGGDSHEAVLTTYRSVLTKFRNANLKISASKTHVFPQSVDILGWVWSKGGFLSASPHRQAAVKNTCSLDIKTVRDMRSWIGIYKTMLIATPGLSDVLDPFDKCVANRDSKEAIVWTDSLVSAFTNAINHVKNVNTLYMPHPDDQLLLIPDGSQKTPGIGHVLMAIKDGKQWPVRFHSVKIPEHCKKWQPCEVEALAFATGI